MFERSPITLCSTHLCNLGLSVSSQALLCKRTPGICYCEVFIHTATTLLYLSFTYTTLLNNSFKLITYKTIHYYQEKPKPYPK